MINRINEGGTVKNWIPAAGYVCNDQPTGSDTHTALFWGSCHIGLVFRFLALLGSVTLLGLTTHFIDTNEHQEGALKPSQLKKVS